MTCIAVIRDLSTGKVNAGADTCRSMGDRRCPDNTPKIWEATIGGRSCIVGCAGSSRYAEIAQYFVRVASDAPTYERLEEHLRYNWIPAFRNVLNEFNRLSTKEGQESADSRTLVACSEGIFIVMGDFNLSRVTEPYAAIGSGEVPAMTWLAATEGLELSPRKRLKEALEEAERRILSVGGPFNFLSL